MKKTYQTTLCTIAISLFFIVIGCSKGGDSTTSVTNTQLLTASDWIYTAQQSKAVSSSVWTDDFVSLKACQKDNHLVFRVNGTFESNEGPTKCYSSDPQISETGTWSFAQNETVLVVISGGQTTNATIEALTATTLVVSITEIIGGVTYQVKQTFGHL